MDKVDESSRWFTFAEHDLDAALVLAGQVRPSFEIVCYHCQQCAEKMLKGFIALKGGKLQKIHDLVVLCDACSGYDSDFKEIIHKCSDLTIFASETRYPSVLEIERYHMEKAIEDVKKIREFILDKL